MREYMKDHVAVGLGAALLLLVLVEATAVPHYSPKFWFHHVPGYSAIIGLFGCIVVVQISKWLGKLFLQGPEEE